MRSRVRKRLSNADRRQSILDAAVLSFAAEGYDATSMDRIAVRAKISKPVLYDHFSSKLDLYLAVLEHIRDGLIAKGNEISRAIDDREERFRRGVNAFLVFVKQQPDAARVFCRCERRTKADQIWRKVQIVASMGISRLLVPYLADRPPWQLHAATEFIKVGLHAVGQWWLENPGPSREELVDAVMKIVWAGIGGNR